MNIKSPKFLFLLFLLIPLCVYCVDTRNKVTNYDTYISMNNNDSILNIRTNVSLNNIDSTDNIKLQFNQNVKLKSIIIENKLKKYNVSYAFVGKNTLRMTIPAEVRDEKKFKIEFLYDISIGKVKFPMVLDRGNYWYPLITCNIAKFKLTAKVPSNFTIFSAGNLISQKKTSKYAEYIYESKIPVFKLPLIITEKNYYKSISKKINGDKIFFFYSTVDDTTANKILSEICNAFEFYNTTIGEYPNNMLNIVEIPQFKGTDIATGLLMVGSYNIMAFEKGYYNNLDFFTATQWFGAGVFFKLFAKGFSFLEISLPQYLKLKYIEKRDGEMIYKNSIEKGLNAYKEIVGTGKDIPIIEVKYPNTREKGIIIRGKGVYIFSRINAFIGDTSWQKFVRDIYKNYKGKILTLNDFEYYLNKYDKSKKCVQKIEKWLREPGMPTD